MNNTNKVALFDIGSNAIRMVVAEVSGTSSKDPIKLLHRHRIPFRLGHDAFTLGRFSDKTLKRARQIFKGMVTLARKEGAERIEAVATSAMRDSQNARELIDFLKEKHQLTIRVISGEEEAAYLYHAIRHVYRQHQGAMAMIDIGGGSTEISLAQDGQMIMSKSFNIGTIRIIEAKSQKALHQIMQQYGKGVETLLASAAPLLKGMRVPLMIGTGGNLRRFGKLKPLFFRSDDASSVTLPELSFMHEEMRKYTAKELQKKFDLKRDRAQTIKPAMSLALLAMESLGAKRLELPNVGLADGVLLHIQDKKF